MIPFLAGYHLWKPAAWLRVSGEDAPGFLQGQFTNDIRNVSPGNGLYGLWLNHKGRVMADGFVVAGSGPQEYWIGSYFSDSSTVRARLEAYIVADDVVVEDFRDSWTGITLFGDEIQEWLAKGPREGVFFRGRRSSQESWEWVFPDLTLAATRPLLAGLPELTAPEMECRRIAAGIAAVPAEIGQGDLPQEGGLEAAAISTTKGCYLGQEVMARMHSRGVARRRLARVSGAGIPPPVPGGLWHNGAQLGQLRSAVSGPAAGEFVGMAMLPARLPEPPPLLATSSGGEPTIRILS